MKFAYTIGNTRHHQKEKWCVKIRLKMVDEIGTKSCKDKFFILFFNKCKDKLNNCWINNAGLLKRV
jgi:hypothetical protein